MTEEILVNVTSSEVRAALVENGVLQEVLIERASRCGLISNIYKGRVSRVLPGMQAAFVDTGLERTAFLHASDIARNPHAEMPDEEEEVWCSDEQSASQYRLTAAPARGDRARRCCPRTPGRERSRRRSRPAKAVPSCSGTALSVPFCRAAPCPPPVASARARTSVSRRTLASRCR